MKFQKFVSTAIITAIILIFSLSNQISAFAETIVPPPDSSAETVAASETDAAKQSDDENVSIGPVSLASCTAHIEYSSVSYDGSEKKPEVVSVITSDGRNVPPNYYNVIYSNNIDVGTATVYLYGNPEYGCYDVLTLSFEIEAAVTGLEQTDKTKHSITLKWDDFDFFPINGYVIYVYNAVSSAWEDVKYQDYGSTETTLDELKSTTAYKVRVAVYTRDETTGELAISSSSEPEKMLTTAVAPPKVVLKNVSAKNPYISLKWKKFKTYKVTKYQIKLSSNPDFSKSRTININSGKITAKKVFGLVNGRRYYFKIRAIKTFDGRTLKGDWSSVKSAAATSTGWARLNKKLYYFVNGVSLKGNRKVDNESYYFDKKTGECHGASYKLWKKIKNTTSRTKYALSVSISKKRVNVFERVKGSWVMKYQWECTTGVNDYNHPGGNFTPIGSFKVKNKLRWLNGEEEEYTVWYATGFYKRIYFHSVLYDFQDIETVQDQRLGIAASHGCIRLSIENAKWIYDNVGTGTRVIIL